MYASTFKNRCKKKKERKRKPSDAVGACSDFVERIAGEFQLFLKLNRKFPDECCAIIRGSHVHRSLRD